MKADIVYIKHIFDAIIKIEKFIEGVSFEQFTGNEMMMAAVVRELEIIGEASNKISGDFQDRHFDIPWSEIIGMRHKLIHDYFGVDINLVWLTCQNNLAELKEKIVDILESETESNE